MTVEAATAEKALEEVTGLLGADAEIVRADKVHRGGIGGFFAKEVVQLTARRRSDAPAGSIGPVGQTTPPAAPAARASATAAPIQPQAQPAAPAPIQPQAQPAAPASLRAPGANGAPDPFAEALSRFLAEKADADVPTRYPLGSRPPAQPGASQPLRPPAAVTEDEARPSTPADSDSVRPFTPAALEAGLPSAPARPSAPVPPETPARPEAPAEHEPKAPPAPAAVVLDAPGAPAAAPAPGSDPAAGRPTGAAPGTGSPDWSPEGLLRLGLPVSLVRPMIETPPSTDADWIDAVSRTVARFCGPLGEEPQLLVGPRAHLLAEPLRLPQVDYPDTPPATGSAILALHVPTADLGLVLRLLGDRRLHLVAGGRSWERLSSLRPSLVSWVGAEALPAALAFCASHGLTLGYGRAGAGGPAFHATPLDVALGLRELVGRR